MFNSRIYSYQKEMEDFVVDITDEMLEEQLKEKRYLLQKDHEDILKKLHQRFEDALKQRKSKQNNASFAQLKKQFSLFQTACENIIQTFFPLLCDDQFLSLQTQQEIMIKVRNLKDAIHKYSKSLIKRLNRPKQVIEKEKKIKKQPKQKGKNSKLPMQQYVVMQKWLLQNFHDPYPSYAKKEQMADQSNLSVDQVNNWFINCRERTIKKFVKKGLTQDPIPDRKSQEEQKYP